VGRNGNSSRSIVMNELCHSIQCPPPFGIDKQKASKMFSKTNHLVGVLEKTKNRTNELHLKSGLRFAVYKKIILIFVKENR
jgi:hypothetical protein